MFFRSEAVTAALLGVLLISGLSFAYEFDPVSTELIFVTQTVTETQVASVFFTDTVTVAPTATSVIYKTEWLFYDWIMPTASSSTSEGAGMLVEGSSSSVIVDAVTAAPSTSIVAGTISSGPTSTGNELNTAASSSPMSTPASFATYDTFTLVRPSSSSRTIIAFIATTSSVSSASINSSTSDTGVDQSSTITITRTTVIYVEPVPVTTTSPLANLNSTSSIFASQRFTNTSSSISSAKGASRISLSMSTMSSSSIPITTASALPNPIGCGEYGNFTLAWNDEPSYTPQDELNTPFPPVFNPYHHLYFSNGYVYAPPPDEPFVPVSPPKLLVFFPNDTQDTVSPDASLFHTGEISAGPQSSNNAFWFNIFGAYVGCKNSGTEKCYIDITGYKWNTASDSQYLAEEMNIALDPCSLTSGCRLRYMEMNGFVGLSGIKFNVTAGGNSQALYMDNLSMAWYDKSCEAGLQRLSSRKV